MIVFLKFHYRGVNLEVKCNLWCLPSAIGATEDLDIVLSNLGLVLCDVSLYVLTKNTYLVWALFWSIWFGSEVRYLPWVDWCCDGCTCTLSHASGR